MIEKKALFTIFIIQITEVLGYSLILPYLPLYAKQFGASPFMIGLLLTTFSLFQFFTSPIMGSLSDQYGRKPLLMLSQFSTFLSFIILGFSKSFAWILLSRIIDGALGSNNAITQAYLTDISPPEKRKKVFSYSGVAFGIGFLIGPALGGFLATLDHSYPPFLAALISGISIFITHFALKETVRKHKSKQSLEVKFINLELIIKYFKKPKLKYKLWFFLIFILSHVLISSNFAIYADKRFVINTQDVGFVLAYMGLVTILMRGLVMPKYLNKLSERRLLFTAILMMILSLYWIMRAITWKGIFFVSTLTAIATAIIHPLMKSRISQHAIKNQQGHMMGVVESIQSFAQIIAPIAGGLILTHLPANALIFATISLMFFGLIMLIKDNN